MSPWIGLLIAAATCGLIVILARRPRADATPQPESPPAQDDHTLALTRDADRLAPIPLPTEKPKVPPGMYTFGFIWRWDGKAWHLETPPDCEPITGLAGFGATVWASSWKQLWRRGPDGWSMRPVPVRLQTMHGWSEDAFMTGGNRTVFRIQGDAIEAIGTLPEGISALWGPTPDDVWVVGWSGMIMRWRDGEWTRESSGVATRLTGVFGQGDTVIIVGEKAVALRSNGDGEWTPEGIPERDEYPHSLDAIWGDGRGVWYAVTSGGDILARRDGIWTVEHSTGRQLTAVNGRGADDVFATGLQGRIWRSRGDGRWREESGSRGATLSAVHRQGDDLFVGGDWFFEVT